MELSNDFKHILHNAMLTCVKHTDCDMLSDVFREADWTYIDPILDSEYHPSARELRNKLFDLGQSAVKQMISDYEADKWNPEVTQYSWEGGRLSFDVRWDKGTDGQTDFIRDFVMMCNIKTSMCVSYMGELNKDYYNVTANTSDDEEYTDQYDLE